MPVFVRDWTPEEAQAEVRQAEEAAGVRFDGWEISQVVEWQNIEFQYQPNVCEPLHATRFESIEQAREQPDYLNDFWTVYGHLPSGGVVAIEDFTTEDKARDFLAAVTGDRHADSIYPNYSRAASPQQASDPLDRLMRAVSLPDIAQLGEGEGGQVIDWPEQPDTYHGQRDQRAEEGRAIEPAARLLSALRTGWADQGATVTNYASQERGGLEPGDRVFLAPRSADHDR